MWRTTGLGALVLFALLLVADPAPACLPGPVAARLVKRRLAGQLVEYTRRLGVDRRIWSPSLQQWRDLDVYLPPGYDPCRRYPLLLWLHGISQDEESFVHQALDDFDEAIACGRLPPMIIAIPDGSARGRPKFFGTNPLFLNSKLGNFEDYVIQDVWGFMLRNYPIRPEREAHVIAGISGGGGAAYRLAIKYRETFGVVFGLMPPLNTRWLDCRGRYFGKFDPNCWGWRTDVNRGREVVGRFLAGAVRIRLRRLVYPLYGRGPETIEELSRENPIEMIDLYGLHPGELAMFVGYGGRDQFNMDAQVESFLYRARERGLCVAVKFLPHGRHNWRTGQRLLSAALCWLAPQLAPFNQPCLPLGG
jgi:S-formylglutathione hydrolase FrmB